MTHVAAAHAADGKIPPKGPSPLPGTCEVPSLPPNPNKLSALSAKNTKLTGKLISGLRAAFCGTPVTSGAYWVGLLCGVVVIAGIQFARQTD